MNAIVKLTLPALIAGAMFAAAGFARAQQPVVQGGHVGTRMLVSGLSTARNVKIDLRVPMTSGLVT
jgi:hypothetical protein